MMKYVKNLESTPYEYVNGVKAKVQNAATQKPEILYHAAIVILYIHLAGLFGIYVSFTAVKATVLFNFLLIIISLEGVAAGAHRLWSHKAYKAKKQLQIILMLLQSIAAQFTVENWVRDHRLHHKYSDTDADPHNPSRGFFFAHIGWLLVKKHNDVKEKGKTIDISDIKSNPILAFQKKYAFFVIGSLGFVLPTLIPMYFWSETLTNAYHVTMLRYCVSFNIVLFINSLGHSPVGYKPYDKNILPSQSFTLHLLGVGEGYHNFHHVFPWDYRSSELGLTTFNLTTSVIDFFAWIGWAYDLKSANQKVIDERAERTGDGSR